MPTDTDRANAQALPKASQTNYRLLRQDYADLEIPIYDLMLMLKAAAHLQEEGDEDLHSSAKLIVELAAQRADDLNEQYQKSFPGEGINSRIDEDGLTAKAFILRELDECERRLKESRTQAEALRKEGV